MFGKSKKEKEKEKALKKIKKEQKQIDSFKKIIEKKEEEIVKMGRLALKDGKVVPSSSVEKEETTQNPMPPPPSPPPEYREQQEQPQAPQEHPAFQQPQAPQEHPVFQQPPVPQEHPAFEQPMPPQQPPRNIPESPQFNNYGPAAGTPGMPPREQYIPRAAPEPEPVDVNIIIVSGQQIKVQVAANEVEHFIGALEDAVNRQVLIPVGRQMINGRNIAFFNTS